MIGLGNHIQGWFSIAHMTQPQQQYLRCTKHEKETPHIDSEIKQTNTTTLPTYHLKVIEWFIKFAWLDIFDNFKGEVTEFKIE